MSKASSSKKGKREGTRNRKNPPDGATRNSGRWTEGRYRSFVTSALRSAFRRWPPKFDTLKGAFAGRRVNPKSGRDANHYLCAKCGEAFPQSNVQVDHREPISSTDSWDVFIERLFCEADNLQVLCKPCHQEKTKKEREELKSRKV